MNKLPLLAGRVVRSTAGRDRGRPFLVIRELDDDFVLMADGDLRKLDRPKKKRRKHLRSLDLCLTDSELQSMEDHQIRKLLQSVEPRKEG